MFLFLTHCILIIIQEVTNVNFFHIFDYADGQTHYGCVALKQEAKLLLG